MRDSAPASANVPSPETFSRPVILVADDYPENRRLLYFYLRDRYEVLHAATAEEAIETLRTQSVDLAILDLNFCDGMSGIDAIQAIRKDPAISGIRALALTAYAYPDDRQRCLDAGFDDYIAKPVFKKGLLETIGKMFGDSVAGDGAISDVGNVWVSRPRHDEE